MCEMTVGSAVSVAEFSGRGCSSLESGYRRVAPRYIPMEALSGDALRRHVLLKAAEKARKDVLQARLCSGGLASIAGPNRRTLVIDLEVLCRSIHVCAYNGQIAHRVWPRPHFRVFLESVRRLFRLAVWSRRGGPWADAALEALDPRQELLPGRCLSAESSTGTEGMPAILDDGDAVHPADVIIVSPIRHAFGRMAPNVIEVESYNVSCGGQHDNVLLDLANLLERHLAVDVGAAADDGAATNSPGATPPPPPPQPPLAVPDELRRLGLDAIRFGAAHGGGLARALRHAHPALRTQPPTISVDVRHMFMEALTDPLGLPLELVEGPAPHQEPQERTSSGQHLEHLEFWDLVRPGAESSGAEELDEQEEEKEQERQVLCNAAAVQQLPLQQREQEHQRQQLASGDSLASAASCSSGLCTAEYCSSSVSFDSLGDVAGASLRSNSSGSSAAADGCCSSCAAGAASSEAVRRHPGALRSRPRSQGGEDQQDRSGGGPPKAHSALAVFLRKVRGAVSATQQLQQQQPHHHYHHQQQQHQQPQPWDCNQRSTADGGQAAAAGRASAPGAALKRLTGLVYRSLRRRHRRNYADENAEDHARSFTSSNSSSSSNSTSSTSSGFPGGMHARCPAAAVAAPRGDACPTVGHGASIGGAVSDCADSDSWGRDRQRPSQSRIALMCASLGVSRVEPAATCTLAATAGGIDGCECGVSRERDLAEDPLPKGYPVGGPDFSPLRPLAVAALAGALPPPLIPMTASETDWPSLSGPTSTICDAQRAGMLDIDVDVDWKYAPVRVLDDSDEVSCRSTGRLQRRQGFMPPAVYGAGAALDNGTLNGFPSTIDYHCS